MGCMRIQGTRSSRVCVAALMLACGSPSLARIVIVNQPPGTLPPRPSSIYPDVPGAIVQSDDVTLNVARQLDQLVARGIDEGSAADNTAVTCYIGSSPGFLSSLVVRPGTQVGADLVFDLSTVTLPAGTYWFAVAVTRTAGDGQWNWRTADTVRGSESYTTIASIVGSTTQPGSNFYGVPADMAFVLTALPAPTSIVPLMACPVLLGRRRN